MGGAEPLEQDRVGLGEQFQGFIHLPAGEVEVVGELLLEHVALGLQGQIPVEGADVDKAHVKVAVT